MSIESLQARVAALEKKLGLKASQSDARKNLVAEIKSLEKRLGMYMDDDVIPGDGGVAAPAPAPVDELGMEDMSACGGGMLASEKDPSGIEEEITQDKFTEVEGITHGEELADFDSTEDAGRNSPGLKVSASDGISRLKRASMRLDRVADYLEKHGRREMAFRIDKIADALDARINGGK